MLALGTMLDMTGEVRPLEELRELASELGLELKPRNERWPGVAGGNFFGAVVLARKPGEPLMRLSANDEWLKLEIEHNGRLCFAGPVPDRVLAASMPLGRFSNLDVFVPAHIQFKEEICDWLGRKATRLSTILGDNERFVIASNKVVFILEPRGWTRDRERIRALASIVSQLPGAADDPEAEDPQIPLSLRALADLLPRWGISDDEARGEAIAAAADDDLVNLCERVLPHLDQINAVLSHPTAELVGLGDLAQAALVARGEIASRQGPSSLG